jgi:ADP-ribose pyrophosphatase YjhB (NUDIX family)
MGARPDDCFCGCCGAPTQRLIPEGDHVERAVCPACGHIHYHGPQLLVLLGIFAEQRMLMIKRGQPPFAGSWSVPGGYVERNESLEGAAIRETFEESGVELHRDQLVPMGMLSVPTLNQVHIAFLVQLEKRLPLRAQPPEVIDAGWFRRDELADVELWPPAHDFDIDLIFARGAGRRFDFYQRTDESMRMITEGTRFQHIWPLKP